MIPRISSPPHSFHDSQNIFPAAFSSFSQEGLPGRTLFIVSRCTEEQHPLLYMQNLIRLTEDTSDIMRYHHDSNVILPVQIPNQAVKLMNR